MSQASFLVAPTVGVICFESSVQYQPTVQFGMDSTHPLQAGCEQFVDQNESCQVRTVKLSSHDCLSYYGHQCNITCQYSFVLADQSRVNGKC